MRKTAIALSAFALTLTLGACGDNGDGGNGGDANGSGNSGSGAVVAANMADLAKSIGDKTSDVSTAHMKLTGDAAGQEITGEGDIKFGDADAAMTMDLSTAEGDMSMVLLDGVMYLKLPQEVEPGKPWIKIDSSSDSELAKALGSVTEQMSKNADPRATLEQFEQAGEITDTKEEELDGTKTTHYTIKVDVQKMADNQEDATLKEAMQEAIKAGLKDFPVDVWVDEENLPVRIALEMPAPDPTTGQTMNVGFQVDYTAWGEPVDITPPPADQVAELPA